MNRRAAGVPVAARLVNQLLNWTPGGERQRFLQPMLKRCQCGAAYDLMGWLALQLVGVQNDGAGVRLVMRNCRCRSTIAIDLKRSQSLTK